MTTRSLLFSLVFNVASRFVAIMKECPSRSTYDPGLPAPRAWVTLTLMPLNILKLCIGIDEVEQLRTAQARRLQEHGALRHLTRNRPRRADEIIGKGSLYWVIRGYVQVRQMIIAIETVRHEEGKRCALVLDPKLVLTEHQPRRPHQGWRYLDADDSPQDLSSTNATGAASLPAPLVRTLKEIGAW